MLADCVECGQEFRIEELTCSDCIRKQQKPPSRVRSERVCLKVGHLSLYVDVGFYPNGRICHVFIDCGKEGTLLRDCFHAWAISLSIGFRRGLRAKELLSSFIHLKSHPGILKLSGSGPSEKLEGKEVGSPFEAIARWLIEVEGE